MGVIKFNGISSKDLGVEVETFPDYVAPEKEYQVTHVPGRNGDLVVDTKTFQNVPRSYEVSVATNGVPIDVVNAAVARFKSSSRMPIKSLKSEIKAVQDLHGYDHPWPAGGGKNKFDISSITTGHSININNGGLDVNDSWNVSDFIPMTEEKVTLSWESTSNFYQAALAAYDSTKAFISGSTVYYKESGTYSHTFDVPSNAKYIRIGYSVVVGSVAVERNNIRLSVGTSDLGYEPYSNICPITGFDNGVITRCGKNFYEPTSASQSAGGITCTNNNDGTYTCSNQATRLQQFSLGTIKLPAGTYVLSGCPIGGSLTTFDLRWTNSYIDRGSGVTITSDGNTTSHVVITIRNGYNCGSGITFKPMICKVDTPNPDYAHFEKKSSTTYNIPFGQTVYGGRFNVTTGELTITHGYKTYNGSENWLRHPSDTTAWFYIVETVFKNLTTDILSNMFTYNAGRWNVNNSIWDIYNQIHIRPDSTVSPSGQTDAGLAEFKAYLAQHPLEICVELATPITYQLTLTEVKTLLGENNIFSNTGDVSVKVEPSFPLIINQVAEWLHSASGYARLEDTYEPDYYRMAYYSESVSFENLFNEAGKATLNFICKPQRYLKSGETPVSFTEEGTIQNGTRFSSSPVLKVITDNTQGSISIGNHRIAIKAGAGTDPITIDCELQDAWSGTTNKNPFIVLTDGEFPVIDPGVQTITFDGGVQSVEVTPRWWTV